MENSLYYLVVCFGTALFCIGIVFLLKAPFFKLATSAVRQLDIFLSPALDEAEKDRLILKNLGKLLLSFFKTLFLLALSAIMGILPVYFYTQLVHIEDIDTSSFYFYLSMIIGSCVLFLLNRKRADYSYWSKLLHTIILDNYNIGKYLFRRELKKGKIAQPEKNKPFVIVTGLARAGTTALTNLLYDEKAFHSIDYSKMPFLMAPNLWKRIYNPKEKEMKERAHGDKVLFSENSIEALEEYFFKATLHDSYIHESHLDMHAIEEKDYLSYLSYQELFKQKEADTLYLAKNNNFILRYRSFREHNPDFKLILIFRDPIQHATSLMTQNENFVSQQSDDPFVLSYMNWLGHYEFGLNQKVFDLGNEDRWSAYSKDTLNYWIAIWINYYQHVLSLPGEENLFLVDYEDLLRTPDKLKAKLADHIGVAVTIEPQAPFVGKKKDKDTSKVDAALLEQANGMYEALRKRKLIVN